MKQKPILHRWRSFIAFAIGTILVSLCLYWSYDLKKDDNFAPILIVWVGMMTVFIGGNKYQETIDHKREKHLVTSKLMGENNDEPK